MQGGLHEWFSQTRIAPQRVPQVAFVVLMPLPLPACACAPVAPSRQIPFSDLTSPVSLCGCAGKAT